MKERERERERAREKERVNERNAIYLTSGSVPSVHSEVVIARDRNHSGRRHSGVGVCRHVGDGRVGQELHDHTHVVLDVGEHHR